MQITTIAWKKGTVKLIDQTELPLKLKYLYLKKITALWQAIKSMQVRGAPALGAAGALGVYLGIKDSRAGSYAQFKKELDKAIAYFASSRPTARNLFWALERMRACVSENREKSVAALKRIILNQAKAIIEEDRRACRSIGKYGSGLFKNNDRVLTVCNAGILATIDYGTALGVIYSAKKQGKRLEVYACETRPMLQGARLTAWELRRNNIDTTLICDNMAAALMQQGRIDKVIAGADRITAEGDAANKIGTYNLAVLSRYHGIPFYIAAPASTFDLRLKKGKDIPIEQRKAEELTGLFFKKPIAARGVKVFNPAFDVTPHELITAIISDKGVIRPPYKKNIARLIAKKPCK